MFNPHNATNDATGVRCLDKVQRGTQLKQIEPNSSAWSCYHRDRNKHRSEALPSSPLFRKNIFVSSTIHKHVAMHNCTPFSISIFLPLRPDFSSATQPTTGAVWIISVLCAYFAQHLRSQPDKTSVHFYT